MERKTLVQTIVAITSLFCVATTIMLESTKNSTNLFQSKASQTEYELVLNSENAPAGLTSTYQRSVSSTVRTGYGNNITFTFNNAVSLSGGFAKLGNHGTIYCATDGNDHISGLISIKAVFSTGSLKILSSYVNGPSFITDEHLLTSNTLYTLPDYANSFILEAQDASVEISSINLRYVCQTNTKSFDTTGLYNVEDFESYSADGVGYDSSHNMNQVTNLRAKYYSAYYGAGSNPLSGSGWNRMGSTDYLTYSASAGQSSSKCGLFKSNSSNYFLYFQSNYYFGVPNVIGQGSTLSAWIRGSFSNKEATSNSSYDATVTLIAYYDKMFNASGTNNAATATYTIPANSGWAQYTVTLDSTKPIYGYGIHIAKASGTIYLPVDNIEIYTTSPYGTVNVTGVDLDLNNKSITVDENFTLTSTVSPANATDKSVVWSSSNTSVATVTQNGNVHGVSPGNAIITVTTNDGGYTANCAVTVAQTYPGGSYYTKLTLSGNTVPIEVVLSTRSEVIVYFYGMKPGDASFTSYNSSTGAFVIAIQGTVKITGLGTYDFGNMTGYYRNDQLENVGCTGSVKNLLSSQNNNITIPHPTSYYWNCDGSTSDLQSTFRRRWRNGSAWSYDDSNTDRIEADTINKSSGTNGVKIRPYSSGVGLVLSTAISGGIPKTTANTFCAWIYNPSTSAVSFRFFLYKNADLSSNFEPMGTKSIPAQSWYYLRIGYGENTEAGTVYNFMFTNLGSGSNATFVVDDIWFHS